MRFLILTRRYMQLPLGTTFHGTGEVGGSVERSGKRVSVFFFLLFLLCIYTYICNLGWMECPVNLNIFEIYDLFKTCRLLVKVHLTFATFFCYICRYILGIQMHGAITKTRRHCTSLILGFSACWQLGKPLERLQIQVCVVRWLIILVVIERHLLFCSFFQLPFVTALYCSWRARLDNLCQKLCFSIRQ